MDAPASDKMKNTPSTHQITSESPLKHMLPSKNRKSVGSPTASVLQSSKLANFLPSAPSGDFSTPSKLSHRRDAIGGGGDINPFLVEDAPKDPSRRRSTSRPVSPMSMSTDENHTRDHGGAMKGWRTEEKDLFNEKSGMTDPVVRAGTTYTVHDAEKSLSPRYSTTGTPTKTSPGKAFNIWGWISPAKDSTALSQAGSADEEDEKMESGEDEACFVQEGDEDEDMSFAFDDLTSLPEEVIIEIFAYLSAGDVLNLLSCSKTIQALARSPAVWKEMYFSVPGWKIQRSNADAYLLDVSPSQRRSTPRSGRIIPSKTSSPIAMSMSPSTPGKKSWLGRQADALRSSPISPSNLFASLLSTVSTETPMKRSHTADSLASTFASPLDWMDVYRERHILEQRWAEGKPTSSVLSQFHTEAVYCVQILHDRLVSGSRDQSVKFFSIGFGDGEPPQLIYTLENAHTKSVLCLQVELGSGSDGGGMMVCGSSDSAVSVWELRNCMFPHPRRKPTKPKRVQNLTGHAGGVLDVVFNSTKIISCSKDSLIKIWSRKDYSVLHTLTNHGGPVNALSLQPNGNFVSAAGDGRVMVWNINSGRLLGVLNGSSGLACVEYRDDIVISGSSDLMMRVMDARTGEDMFSLAGHTELVRTLTFDNVTDRVVSGSYDTTVKLWDLGTGEEVATLPTEHKGMVFNVKMDRTKVVSTSHDNTMVVNDFAGGLKYAKLFA